MVQNETDLSIGELWMRHALDLHDPLPEPDREIELVRPPSDYVPYGAARQLWELTIQQVMISGPSETGKSRAALELLDRLMWKYPGAQGAIIRKTYQDTIATILPTFEKRVIAPALGVSIRKAGGSRPTWYEYSNGSRVWVAGMDKPSRALSSERDIIFVNQAEELTVEEWETLRTRCTGRAGNVPYGQLIGDCNPAAPTHWIKKAADEGRLKMLESRHRDNPTLYNPHTGELTEAGKRTLAVLEGLTGVRKKRLCDGIWAAAEGMVYEEVWDPDIHLVNRRVIPTAWPRYWVVDFGYTNPFCWKAFAQDPDGRLIRYREVYYTGRTVEEHLATILRVTLNEPRPQAIICDHDAEDRATFEQHCIYCHQCGAALRQEEAVLHKKQGHSCYFFNLKTLPAYKAISAGIQAVTARLRKAGDGRPRLQYMRESLVERDGRLQENHKPCCTEEEFEGYVWPKSGSGRPVKEVPVDADNHGMDADRYLVCYLDKIGKDTPRSLGTGFLQGSTKTR